MKTSSLRPLGRLIAGAALCLAAVPASALCSSTAQAWQCWEGSSTSNVSYANGYRDVKLKVTYTKLGQPNLVSYAFWEGAGVFRFRMAFPASGTWTWSLSCESGCNLNDFPVKTGSAVIGSYGGTNPLYLNGRVKTVATVAGDPRFLSHDDGTPFFWLGDTNWVGTTRASAAHWTTYLNDRVADQFSVIQTAMPVDWMDTPRFQARDANGFRPCTPGSCSGVLPRSCSTPNVQFWAEFDRKIQEANDKGLLVALVGLMDPLIVNQVVGQECVDNGPSPTLRDSEAYARYIAARLAGSHVVLSPGFDRKPDIDPDSCGSAGADICGLTGSNANTVSCRIRCIGEELQTAASHLLVTNHWGGGSSSAQIQMFNDQPYLDFQLFQSGQAKSSAGCNQTTQLQEITKRPRELALNLWNDTSAIKPSVNGEAIYEAGSGQSYSHPYDAVTNTCGEVLTSVCLGTTHYKPLRARQAGYLTLLSGGVGYTFGVKGAWDWDRFLSQPTSQTWSTAIASRSSMEMRHLGTIFRKLPWSNLEPEHGRLQNAAQTGTNEAVKRVLAADRQTNTTVVAYLPHDTADGTLKFRLSNLPLVPRSGWWFNPRIGGCTAVTGVVDPNDALSFTFTRPNCPGGSDTACPNEMDWLLVLTTTNPCL